MLTVICGNEVHELAGPETARTSFDLTSCTKFFNGIELWFVACSVRTILMSRELQSCILPLKSGNCGSFAVRREKCSLLPIVHFSCNQERSWGGGGGGGGVVRQRPRGGKVGSKINILKE
jgi:hypothetical protein